jgi:hypothetical protein
MDVSRKLGILVFCGVPIVYAVFGSYIPMWIYQIILLFFAGAFVSK